MRGGDAETALRCINVAMTGSEAAESLPLRPDFMAHAAFLRASLALMLSTSARGVAANRVLV